MMNDRQVYLLYDERMTLHKPIHYECCQEYPAFPEEVPSGYLFERPERLLFCYESLMALPSANRFVSINSRPASREAILMAHTCKHYEDMEATSHMTEDKLLAKSLADQEQDMYYCPDSFQAACLACGGVLECTKRVLDNDTPIQRAIALVRPPGHHACQSQEQGFCFFNSVAVAAKNSGAKRVVILDWDVHHGNGTQELVWDDKNITYISLHRFGTGTKYFFPGTGSSEEVAGGINVNVAWTQGGMGNAEYAAAFSELILPLLIEVDPDLILVSSGLDAAENDLIGDCKLSADMFFAMTRSLLRATSLDIPIVVALEGGYNIPVIGKCLAAIANALLDAEYEVDKAEVDTENLFPENVPLSSESSHSSTDSSGHDPTRKPQSRLDLARRELSRYWTYPQTIRSSAARDIHRTMTALEATSMWNDRLKFRRLRPMPTPKKTPRTAATPRTATRTRAYRAQQEQATAARDAVQDLNETFKSLAM